MADPSLQNGNLAHPNIVPTRPPTSAHDGQNIGNLHPLAGAAAAQTAAATSNPSTPMYTANNIPRYLINPTWGATWSAHSAQYYKDYDLYGYGYQATVIQHQPPYSMAQPPQNIPLPPNLVHPPPNLIGPPTGVGLPPSSMDNPALPQPMISQASDACDINNLPPEPFGMAMRQEAETPNADPSQTFHVATSTEIYSLPQNPRRLFHRDRAPIPPYPQFDVERDTPHAENLRSTPRRSSDSMSDLGSEIMSPEEEAAALRLFGIDPNRIESLEVKLSRVIEKIMQKHMVPGAHAALPATAAAPPATAAAPPATAAAPPVIAAAPPVTAATQSLTTAALPVTAAPPPLRAAAPQVTAAQPPITAAMRGPMSYPEGLRIKNPLGPPTGVQAPNTGLRQGENTPEYNARLLQTFESQMKEKQGNTQGDYSFLGRGTGCFICSKNDHIYNNCPLMAKSGTPPISQVPLAQYSQRGQITNAGDTGTATINSNDYQNIQAAIATTGIDHMMRRGTALPKVSNGKYIPNQGNDKSNPIGNQTGNYNMQYSGGNA